MQRVTYILNLDKMVNSGNISLFDSLFQDLFNFPRRENNEGQCHSNT